MTYLLKESPYQTIGHNLFNRKKCTERLFQGLDTELKRDDGGSGQSTMTQNGFKKM